VTSLYVWTWIGIIFCVSQSALFSGLNLAYFSITRLRLEVEASTGSHKARRILKKRQNYNYLLATILWGNVGINVLLTLLTDSVMTGVGAFVFSTVVITLVGEIIPQAYFSRHAMTVGYYLAPVISFYEYLLYPVVKPVAMVLDYVLGPEAFHYFREPDLKEFIREHIDAHKTEIGRIEGIGALNFLTIDDLEMAGTGVPLDPDSIIELPEKEGGPVFPEFERTGEDPFVHNIQKSGKKWIVFTNKNHEPQYVMNANRFLRDLLVSDKNLSIETYCHEPMVVRNQERELGSVMNQLIRENPDESTFDQDILLLWHDEPRILTGSDILRRLLRGTKLFGL
jgi:hypothetical protein